MGKKEKKLNVKKLVLFKYRDYPDKNFISDFVDNSLVEISDKYDESSNISKDIYLAMLISNMIDCELIKQDDGYMFEKSYNLYNTIDNIRSRNNLPINDLCFDVVLDEVFKEYDGSISYSLFFSGKVNKFYNETIIDMANEEKDELETLEKMEKEEKKLRLLYR